MGVGWLRLSEIEAMAHMRAKIVTANVSKALALYPNECIFFLSFFLGFFASFSACSGFGPRKKERENVRFLLGGLKKRRLGRFCFVCTYNN